MHRNLAGQPLWERRAPLRDLRERTERRSPVPPEDREEIRWRKRAEEEK